jgi:hypothetical protein
MEKSTKSPTLTKYPCLKRHYLNGQNRFRLSKDVDIVAKVDTFSPIKSCPQAGLSINLKRERKQNE